jgi:hypothetical protein
VKDFRFLAVAMAVLTWAQPAESCSLVCLNDGSAKDYRRMADWVLVGRVLSVEWDEAQVEGIATVEPLRIVKGKGNVRFLVRVGGPRGGGACTHMVAEGDTRLLFLAQPVVGAPLEVDACSPSGLLDKPQVMQALKELRVKGTYR